MKSIVDITILLPFQVSAFGSLNSPCLLPFKVQLRLPPALLTKSLNSASAHVDVVYALVGARVLEEKRQQGHDS